VVEALDERKLKVLRYLARRTSEGDGSPSVREVGAAVGLRSTRSAHAHLMRLEKDGYVSRVGRRARSIRLTAGRIPLLGRVAAGRGLEAVPLDDEVYSLVAELLSSRSGKRRYLLRAKGDSMVGAWIGDGSLLVVEENEDPPDGTVVVALIGNGEEVTVKKLYRDGEAMRLVPENGQHEEIVVSAEEVRIQGEVVYVVQPPRR
jgi:repressor LexA